MKRRGRPRKPKLTNIDILPPASKKGGHVNQVIAMRLEEEVIKLRAQHWTYDRITDWLQENHPKPNGKKWYRQDVMMFFKVLETRKQAITSRDDSVVVEATEAAFDTIDHLKRVNRQLWQLSEELDASQKFGVERKVKIMHALMRAIELADKLQSRLPVDPARSGMTNLNDFKKMIDKLVADGILIVADKTKLTAFEVYNEKEKPKEEEPMAEVVEEEGRGGEPDGAG